MQATQRKTEYRPSSAASGKRVVKMDGNVAYIRKGERTAPRSTSGTSHPVRVGSPKSASGAKNATHPIRNGRLANAGSPKSREALRGNVTRVPISRETLKATGRGIVKVASNTAKFIGYSALYTARKIWKRKPY
jgi:hypothetical protein